MTNPFDLSQLIVRIKAAALDDSGATAIFSILQQSFQNPEQVRRDMPHFQENDTILHEDETVSIWHCRFDPGFTVPAHDHQIAAFIAIYAGAERNKMFKRVGNKEVLSEKEVILKPGDVFQIQPDEIHAVSCASEEPCRGIHVYLGNLNTVKRSLFDTQRGEELEFSDENYHRLTTAV